jgi:hypothetical protein
MLDSKDFIEGDYEKYIQPLTKANMSQLFIQNFGGWSKETSKRKFFNVLKNGLVKLFFLEDQFIGYVSYSSEKKDLSLT